MRIINVGITSTLFEFEFQQKMCLRSYFFNTYLEALFCKSKQKQHKVEFYFKYL